jgi:hypothetical protein
MHRKLNDDELRDEALDVLCRHLGAGQTLRFLSWLRSRPRDYAAWRDAHFDAFTADDLIRAMREIENNSQARPSTS